MNGIKRSFYDGDLGKDLKSPVRDRQYNDVIDAILFLRSFIWSQRGKLGTWFFELLGKVKILDLDTEAIRLKIFFEPEY